ncbi:hypothetical protein EJ06DRAFT_529966 [Trichodelitschia bisporula]|uniref:Uncharacterized protein n=1 Tax=Trichodelitschia bisporula TaxID=703511 RepID=A0A6G1HY57_9PEZI|nr:hypothetical protein EJ06DRAFT_529966 [Trichodelitschia bisporula]
MSDEPVEGLHEQLCDLSRSCRRILKVHTPCGKALQGQKLSCLKLEAEEMFTSLSDFLADLKNRKEIANQESHTQAIEALTECVNSSEKLYIHITGLDKRGLCTSEEWGVLEQAYDTLWWDLGHLLVYGSERKFRTVSGRMDRERVWVPR